MKIQITRGNYKALTGTSTHMHINAEKVAYVNHIMTPQTEGNLTIPNNLNSEIHNVSAADQCENSNSLYLHGRMRKYKEYLLHNHLQKRSTC